MNKTTQKKNEKNSQPDFMEKIHRYLRHTILGKITIHGGAYQLKIPREVIEYYQLGVGWDVKAVLVEARLTLEEA